MIHRVVILGGHIQALGLARQVAAKSIEVVLLVDTRYAVAKYSKAVHKTYIYHSTTELEQWIETLCLPHKECLLFPTNDEMVEFLSHHYADYQQRCALGIPNPETVDLFNDKRKAYQFAESHHIPCPECWYPNTIAEVEALAPTLPYPVVVKPAIMYSFHTTFGKKAFRCDNAEQLLAIYKRIADADYPLEKVLIQEFLSGGPQYLFSYGVMAENGTPIASLIANRIRQNPMDFGNSTTFAITCDVPDIARQSEQLLHLVNYWGMGEVEWMFDPKSGQYKFLEINTRAWKWHTISNQLGFSFIGTMIDVLNSNEMDCEKQPATATHQVGWVERLTDWAVITKEVLHHRMNLSSAVQTYKIQKENAVWSWQDPLPGIMYILLSPILYILRY